MLSLPYFFVFLLLLRALPMRLLMYRGCQHPLPGQPLVTSADHRQAPVTNCLPIDF
jgi:hypothetical protein